MTTGVIENSEISFEGASFIYGNSNTDSVIIINNRFNVPTAVSATSITPHAYVANNYFQGSFRIGSEGATVLHNEINGEFRVTTSQNAKVAYNRINGIAYFYLSQNAVAYNNYVNGVAFCSGNYGRFLFNNIAHENGNNTFFVIGSNWQIWNNNLPDSVYDAYNTGTNVYGWNNYYPGTDDNYDLNAFHFNPQYQFAPELRAENPNLIGRAYVFSEIEDDIDGMLRSNRPSVGANEICLSNYDTLTLTCGDSIPLLFCNAPQSGNYTWQPSTGLSNALTSSPLASPATSTLYVVTESNTGFVDSVYINVIPFSFPVSDYAPIRCGNSTVIHAPFNASATYQWSPSTGLTDAQAPFTQATLFETTTYTITVDINGCGIYTDSITVLVDSLPWPYFNYNASEGTVAFTNTSTCADEYAWDFGDSTGTSTDENPVYTFPQSGSYLVTLTATNAYGSRQYTNWVNVIGPCSASFILYPDSAVEHNWFLLATGSGTSPLTYLWEWGDGTTTYNEANPSHTYNEPGYYTICLTITDYYGCIAQYCDSSAYIYKTGAEMITVNVINQINVGIEEEGETENDFLIYPNPATTTLTIESTVNSPQTTVAIHNAQGQLVTSSVPDSYRDENPQTTIDISSFSNGIYFLTLTNGEQTLSRKFVKQ